MSCTLFQLRVKMVNQEIGNMTDLPIKFHYDDYVSQTRAQYSTTVKDLTYIVTKNK